MKVLKFYKIADVVYVTAGKTAAVGYSGNLEYPL
jgi:hypothetical protein